MTTHGSLSVAHHSTASSSARKAIRVFGEPIGDVAIQPAAAVVERGGEVPVVERGHREDARLAQCVDEAAVEIETFLIHAARAVGEDAAPGNTEAVSLQAEAFHDGNVFGIAVVVIAGHVAGVAIGHAAGRVAEAVPDARAGAVRERRPFDLIRGGCGAPDETVGEAEAGHRFDLIAIDLLIDSNRECE